MVFFFKSEVVSPAYVIYMGADKNERDTTVNKRSVWQNFLRETNVFSIPCLNCTKADLPRMHGVINAEGMKALALLPNASGIFCGLVEAMVLTHPTDEDLIRWGWPEDVWFHVDKVSSAHVYLRLKQNETLDDVPQAVIDDCAQLVKANSIQGNKMSNIEVVYTLWSNLKKTAGMEVGQVGFHKNKEVRKVKVEKRINEAVNRLNKTKEERFPDLRSEREERDRIEREDVRKKQQELKRLEKEEEKKRQEQAELRSYESLFKTEKMTTNKDDGNDSDDFI